ncbi:MAG: NPCBM/NEW2 domain-containing protein [Phycisphaerae bacterium]|nr:NPCBM/NEW2 domain-containing protein [Phycisphaerae bacterium]
MPNIRSLLMIIMLVATNGMAESVRLSDLEIDSISQEWGSPVKNRSVSGSPLKIKTRAFTHGVGTHAASVCHIKLDGEVSRFQAFVGIDSDSDEKGSVEFLVELESTVVWRSGVMKGGEPAKEVDLDLAGAKEMTLVVTTAGDGNSSDHADWADATLTYKGEKPHIVGSLHEFAPVQDMPGGPDNAPAVLTTGPEGKTLTLHYNGDTLMTGDFAGSAQVSSAVTGDKAIEQRIKLSFATDTECQWVIHGSPEALAAETRGQAQERLAVVRTSHGLSNNLRNNALYDRNLDWMLEAPAGTVIKSSRNADGTTRFELCFTAKQAELIFRPRYYQKHKNLPYFQPWTYSVRKDSISGWCSWWAYMRNCRQSHVDAVMKVWNENNLGDYGYRFIQLDDVYQGGKDAGRQLPPEMRIKSYIGGRPDTWLEWKRDKFPSGMTGYVESVETSGFAPALWVGCFFTDKETADTHPDWFVQGQDGKPFVGNWVTYVVDATNPDAADALIRPTFRGLKHAGFEYIKIDQLRHMLYDNLNHNHDYMIKTGKRPDDIFRAYLRIAREELGEDCFVLSCWGVLPESIGLADACRIGGDGYGPVTLQQYNSWNGIVWRNDPDHCDVSPRKAAQGEGNVLQRKDVEAIDNDTLIRPALASMAGAMLMLSDKVEVYEDARNLVGARRSAPVLFSVPGQLYDFDPKKTDSVKIIDRALAKGGTAPGAIDGDQFGEVCPFWLNEFNMPFEHWYVLHRLNWTGKDPVSADPVTLTFGDLGLDPAKAYLVYEFWSNTMLGVLRDGVSLGRLEPMGLESLAIRETLGRPQLVSTNRHLSQGAAEIEKMVWQDNTLVGRSQVIVDDPYVLTVYVSPGYVFKAATVNGQKAETTLDGRTLKVSYRPEETASVGWEISFNQQSSVISDVHGRIK